MRHGSDNEGFCLQPLGEEGGKNVKLRARFRDVLQFF